MRTCSRCGVEKPLDAFSPRKGRRSGRASACRPCASRRQLERRKSGQRTTYLPIEPFRAWLNDRIAYYDTTEEFASAIDTKERRVWEWRHRANRVSLSTVDRILILEGSTMLEELYPLDLYPE